MFAFGVATTVYGAWQIGTGRRDMRVVYGMIGVIVVVLAIALVL